MSPVGRNQPCPCGSGKAYKNCHGVLRTQDGKPGLAGLPRSEDRRRRMLAALEAQRSARIAEAAALYQSVLDEEPDNFDALHMLGVARYELGELSQAEALVQRAIAVNPGVASAHANLRLIRAAQEWSGAEEQLCREVEQMRTMHRQVDTPAISSDVRVIAFYLP